MRLLTGSREAPVADTVIRDPARPTTFDQHGAVHSIQAADLTMPEAELDAIWSPMHLERLARTYWKYLSRVTLGLIRVAYTPTERYVVLIARPFVLLRFRAPEYAMDDRRGVVRWRIRDGILVASEGHEGDGYLEIDIRRRPAAAPARATLHVEVEIASFYPAIAFRIARWVYANTQSRIHVLVTHGFLRSLSNLELEKSVIGRFAPEDGGPPEKPVTVGDTPWPVVGALLAAAAAAFALIRRRSS
jgi:MYXO-CTERM domain-containing protein